jgi:hypothetical protein
MRGGSENALNEEGEAASCWEEIVKRERCRVVGKEDCGGGWKPRLLVVIEGEANGATGGGAAGDGLGEFHVTQAGGKVGELDAILLADGADEFCFDPPAAEFFCRNFDLLQLKIAAASRKDSLLRSQFDFDGAFAAIEMNLVAGAKSSDAADVVNAASAVGERGQYLDAVGRADASQHAGRRIESLGREGRNLGQDTYRFGDPTNEGLVDDAHGESIEAREFCSLPPMQRLVGVGETVVGGEDDDFAKLSQESTVDQFLNGAMDTQSEGAGNNMTNQMRIQLAGFVHLPGLGSVERHAGLAEHMLAAVDRGESHWAVQVGPGANDDCIDTRIGDEILPVVESPRDVELARCRCGRFRAAIADRDDFDLRTGPQARDVTQTRIRSEADDADSYCAR